MINFYKENLCLILSYTRLDSRSPGWHMYTMDACEPGYSNSAPWARSICIFTLRPQPGLWIRIHWIQLDKICNKFGHNRLPKSLKPWS